MKIMANLIKMKQIQGLTDLKNAVGLEKITGEQKSLNDRLDEVESTVGSSGTLGQDVADLKTSVENLKGKESDTKDSVSVTGAKKYADSLIEALDAKAVTTGTKEVIDSVEQVNGVVTVTKKTLTADDIPNIEQSQVNGLTGALNGKQDKLVFNTAYNATDNKAATMSDVTTAVAGLSGAMHYRGKVETVPTTKTIIIKGSTDSITCAAGDVVIFGNKEYIFDGENWSELGDESIYAVKGSIKDADIADDAAIAQTKIAGLTASLKAAKDDALAADEKVVTKQITNITASADGATSFIVSMTPDTGYSIVANSNGKVIVNGVVYVVEAAASVTVAAGFGLETGANGDEVYVEFREVKTATTAE